MIEIELHACSPHQALEHFISVYNKQVKKGSIENIIVIHGYGSTGEGGKIKRLLRKYLESYEPDRVGIFTGENQYGNPGITTVMPREILPGLDELLAKDLLDYCKGGKSEDKIMGEFRDYRAPFIKKAIKRLEGEKKLIAGWKGNYKFYQTAIKG